MKLLCITSAVLLLAGCVQQDKVNGCIGQALQSKGMADAVLVYDVGDGVRRWYGWRMGIPAPWVRVKAASLSKPIVAAELARLARERRLELDVPLTDVLLAAPESLDRRVTIRRLIQHTSGLQGGRPGPDPLFRGRKHECLDAGEWVMNQPLVFEPGTQVAYNNSGYCLMGMLLAQLQADSGNAELWLTKGLGGAGGWESTLDGLYGRLKAGLPISHIPAEALLEDGSHYGFAWRSWPAGGTQAPFAHYGRLPGMVSIALSDGADRLLVAHIKADPKDVQGVSLALGDQLWSCLV